MIVVLLALSACSLVVQAIPDQQCIKVSELINSPEIEDCCKFPDFPEYESCLKDMKSKGLHPFVMQFRVYECAMKNMDALTEGSVDLSKFLRYVDQQFAGTVWIPIIKKSSTDCYARVSGKTEDFRKLLMLPGFVRPEDCNIGLMAFLECTLNEIDTACPASFELNTVECKSAKEALIKCNSNIENVVMSYIGQIPAASRSA